MLCYLQHPSVVEKTVSLNATTKVKVPDFDAEVMKRNKGYGGRILSSMESNPNILNIHFLFCLKDVQKGWTMDHRKVYLAELKTLMSKYRQHVHWLHRKNQGFCDCFGARKGQGISPIPYGRGEKNRYRKIA